MNLPYEAFQYGAAHQPPLAAGGLVLLPAVCYDDAYGSSNLRHAAHGQCTCDRDE